MRRWGSAALASPSEVLGSVTNHSGVGSARGVHGGGPGGGVNYTDRFHGMQEIQGSNAVRGKYKGPKISIIGLL